MKKCDRVLARQPGSYWMSAIRLVQEWLASIYLFHNKGKMKKKMVCIALFSTMGLAGSFLSAQAMTDEYALTAEEMSPEILEDDGLPLNYELELEETDQPFITDESFPGEEEVEGGVWEQWREEAHGMTGTSLKEDQ